MEYAVGRASQKSCARSYNILEPEGTKWHWYKWFAFAGNYILMMFYTTVAGWMIAYAFKMATGQLTGLGTSASASASGAAEQAFTALLADPFQMLFWMVIICGIGFFIVGLGLQNGVERVTKVMMACLFVAIVILAINSIMLPGAHAGLEFYLMPDFGKMIENGFGDAGIRRHGPGILHAFHRRFGHGDFRQLHRPRPSPDGRSGKRRRPFHAHFAGSQA